MATFSWELENVLKNLNDLTESVLPLCSNMRNALQEVLHKDVHFRNYPYDSLRLFEYISDMERAALWVITGIEAIRRQNADLMSAEDMAAAGSADG